MKGKGAHIQKIGKILGVVIVLSIAGAFLYRFLTTKSALKIESVPEALVLINGEQVGKTPIEIERTESEVDVKLVPEIFTEENISYSTKVELTKNVKTILRYKFGDGKTDSEMLLVSFRRNGFAPPALAVVSIPDGARVRVEGESEGLTPLRLDSLSESIYSVTVDANGFRSSTFEVQPKAGYVLTAFVDLASSDETTQSILDREIEVEEVMDEPAIQNVYISNTPTGFLRVRKDPLLSSEEIGVVSPGEIYPLLDEQDGWYEIQYEASVSGFISSEYATRSATTN